METQGWVTYVGDARIKLSVKKGSFAADAALKSWETGEPWDIRGEGLIEGAELLPNGYVFTVLDPIRLRSGAYECIAQGVKAGPPKKRFEFDGLGFPSTYRMFKLAADEPVRRTSVSHKYAYPGHEWFRTASITPNEMKSVFDVELVYFNTPEEAERWGAPVRDDVLDANALALAADTPKTDAADGIAAGKVLSGAGHLVDDSSAPVAMVDKKIRALVKERWEKMYGSALSATVAEWQRRAIGDWVESPPQYVLYIWDQPSGDKMHDGTSLLMCLDHAEHHACRTEPVTVRQKHSGEAIRYRFDKWNKLVPDTSEPRIIPRAHLPIDQRR